jgi:hypothetical protein
MARSTLYFHAAPREFRELIAATGLQPADGETIIRSRPDADCPDGVYLWDNEANASFFAERWAEIEECEYDLWQVETVGVELLPDPSTQSRNDEFLNEYPRRKRGYGSLYGLQGFGPERLTLLELVDQRGRWYGV